MKKLVLFASVMILVFGAAGFAGALSLTDTTGFNKYGTTPAEDYVGHGYGDVNKLGEFFGMPDFVAWTHHFDFNPPAAEILTASLTLEFKDDENDNDWKPWTLEFAFGMGESGQWAIGEIDAGSYSYGVDVSFLADGNFTVGVASLGGDFSIVSSTLDITYNPVPEPSTVLLLGAGLFGLAAFGRKKLPK